MRTESVNRMPVLKRRSIRMALNARIILSGHDCTKCAFTMPARATKLNKHGAAIELNRELSVGSTVVLQNNHKTQASARVIAQVSALRQGIYTYGVEFVEVDAGSKNFWGINFPSPTFSKCYGVECFHCHYKVVVGTYPVNTAEEIVDVRLPVSPIRCASCGKASVYLQSRLIHFLPPTKAAQ